MSHCPPIKLLPPQAALLSNPAPYNAIIAAQGAGKSFDIGIGSAMFIENCPKMIGIIGANTYGQLSKATLNACFREWETFFGWKKYDAKSNPNGFFVFDKQPPAHFKVFKEFKSNDNIIHFRNGGVIFTVSLDNYTAIEGSEVGWAFLDETADTKEDALTTVITGRLRQKGLYSKKKGNGFFAYCEEGHPFADKPINPLFVCTKPAKVEWINNLFKLERHRAEITSKIYDPNNYFYTNDGIRQIAIYSVFLNRDNLPEGYIRNRLSLLEGTGMEGALIYGDPFSSTGDEYVTAFDKLKHLYPCAINESLPLHFTLDFNTRPYMSGLVMQLEEMSGDWDGRQNWIDLRVIDEYSLEPPKNTAGDLALALCDDYSDVCDNGLYVYGDASGKNAVPIKNTKSAFDDFTTHLSVVYELRVPTQNPRYKAALGKGSLGRRAFTNKIFSGKLGVRVLIHPRCKNFIADLDYCKEGPNGDLLKKTNKDGIEERGHHMQAFEYATCQPKFLGYLSKIPIDNI